MNLILTLYLYFKDILGLFSKYFGIKNVVCFKHFEIPKLGRVSIKPTIFIPKKSLSIWLLYVKIVVILAISF